MLRPDLNENWPLIRKIFKKSFLTSFQYSFATVNQDGSPHVTPIGSLVLNKSHPKGFYFEIFTARTRLNLERDPRISIMAIYSSKWLWLRALIQGSFAFPPGVRLNGIAGQRRSSTAEEVNLWKRKLGILRFLRGSHHLWNNLETVREIRFESFETIQLGKTTQDLWK